MVKYSCKDYLHNTLGFFNVVIPVQSLDLIGFGKSDKPEIDYNFQDHYKYVKAFIDKLQLDDNKSLIIVIVEEYWDSGTPSIIKKESKG